jgi:hypothetical protein
MRTTERAPRAILSARNLRPYSDPHIGGEALRRAQSRQRMPFSQNRRNWVIWGGCEQTGGEALSGAHSAFQRHAKRGEVGCAMHGHTWHATIDALLEKVLSMRRDREIARDHVLEFVALHPEYANDEHLRAARLLLLPPVFEEEVSHAEQGRGEAVRA